MNQSPLHGLASALGVVLRKMLLSVSVLGLALGIAAAPAQAQAQFTMKLSTPTIGDITIEWSEATDHVIMTGPIELEYVNEV